MRQITLALFLLVASLGFSQKRKVVLEIKSLQPYCGGAAPTEEMIAESSRPKPYAKKMIIVISEKGKVDSVKTNEKGELKLKLKKGIYKLVEPWRYYLDTPGGVDANEFDLHCLKEEWPKIAYVLEVTKKGFKAVSNQEIIIYCPNSLPCIKNAEVPPGRGN